MPWTAALLDKHRALQRFGGYRWGVAFVASAGVTYAAHVLFGNPPADYREWAHDARFAASSIVQGAWSVSLAGWLFVATSPTVWIGDAWLRWFVRALVAIGVGYLGTEGFEALAAGLPVALRCAEGPAILAAACRATLLPMAIGSMPLVAEALRERIVRITALRRLLSTGVGPSGGWMSGAKLKHFTRPLPRNVP